MNHFNKSLLILSAFMAISLCGCGGTPAMSSENVQTSHASSVESRSSSSINSSITQMQTIESLYPDSNSTENDQFTSSETTDEVISSSASSTEALLSEDSSATWSFMETEPIFDLATNTVTYGYYPQTHVSNQVLIASLESLSEPNGPNGWYLLDGEFYTRETAKPYYPSYFFDDGITIENGQDYWFKCEPIVWDVLSSDDGNVHALSRVLLDVHRYNESYSYSGYSANNYEHSEIRAWLNGEFYETAFALDSDAVLETLVDNSTATTESDHCRYVCADTLDKIFLLSYQDYINPDFGFPSSPNSIELRDSRTTDYARARGAYYFSASEFLYNGNYWTRSPFSIYADGAHYVGFDNRIQFDDVSRSYYCVRPSLRIAISE